MLDKCISGQLIALTKEIKLIEPSSGKCFSTQFIAGNQTPPCFSGGLGVTWWYTQKALDLARDIASIIIKKYESLRHESIDEIADNIKKIFMEICLDSEIFVGDDIFFRQKENLFEARAISNVLAFSKKLWDKIYFNLERTISQWCFIYPIPRMLSESFELNYDGLSIVKSSDMPTWKQLSDEYPSIIEFKGVEGYQADVFQNLNCGLYLVCKFKGASSHAKLNAGLIFKRFLAVLFSVFCQSEKHRLIKSGGKKYRISAQFTDKDSKSKTGYIVSEIGELLPNYIEDRRINTEIISTVQNWYKSYISLNDEDKNRLEKSAHFINHGMNSNGIESFINYFVALDALFGRRGDVERLILEGVVKCTLSNDWKHKAEWLFELRSELVHGGTRYLAEWEKYERYKKHFKSKPEDDVEKLAFICLFYNFKNIH